jgi:hypothetical protein
VPEGEDPGSSGLVYAAPEYILLIEFGVLVDTSTPISNKADALRKYKSVHGFQSSGHVHSR